MAKMDFLKKVNAGKVLSITIALAAGASAVIRSFADQKKDAEFKEMKETLKKLTEEK